MPPLAISDFSDLLEHPFPVTAGGSTLTLVLTDARQSRGGPPGGRQPFALTFRGPVQPLLPQAMYDFQHPTHGVVSLFIVPLGADAVGVTYEAIFS